jgi:hypothetical protein
MNIKNSEHNKRKIYFLSFADRRLRKSLKRIKWQAKEIAVFDKIYCWDERNLDRIFWEKWGNFCKTNRGFGFYIFKPQMSLQVLEEMRDGNILLFCDAGCHIHKCGKRRLLQYCDILDQSESGILAFGQNEIEKIWTKGDLFDYFDVRSNLDITESTQHCGGIFLIKKCDKSVEFVKKWLTVYDDVHLVDDSPSVSPNFEGFREHRHDQSVFSILCKINDVPFVAAYETYPPYPIAAARDKEYCKPPLWKRALGKIKRLLLSKRV